MRALLMTAVMMNASIAFGADPEPREWAAPGGTTVKYRWHAPEKVEEGKRYPLVLFLHGAGERGSDNTAQLKHGVKPLIDGAAQLGEPCYLIAPQCPSDLWWAPFNRAAMRLDSAQPSPQLDAVVALLDETLKKHPVDPARIYVTGISMGGFGTWHLLGRMPERIAAAVPICGGGDPAKAAAFKDVPIWAFHGDADPVVPVRTTQDMIEALQKAGGKPNVTFYPGVDHDSWTRTYADAEVIKWLFAQRRK